MVSYPVWVLETKHGFSARTAGVLNCRDISVPFSALFVGGGCICFALTWVWVGGGRVSVCGFGRPETYCVIQSDLTLMAVPFRHS